ncbi:hypothetical protein HanXRQr2_Chr05g0205951 [Helianthus annuus]|uniref:Uncharacterized protein n=1 Tax=Helianthus annuus TaxID=4232 RepID=A0A251UQ06_HELAN|nr:hypothetical protein HanXRQr2_Chr07g0295161 [Helianthus annuus]KAF5805168.1 hypothetical protein HanXRQr2_Chr05g0205951 [Helianthus annuus]KAJ0550203.1 hypothetical protein HanHA300_Chr07g0242711 [Helianthus annuus]KAJ0563158.1 hypothetical protein HanHA89_Chr07g0259911 [Helianthus annuus]KAJ0728526.1 hypothetical protein HanLR1_Chr07g0242601 [Helianthus annuus]
MKLISHQKPPKPYDFNPINPINSPSPALGPADMPFCLFHTTVLRVSKYALG